MKKSYWVFVFSLAFLTLVAPFSVLAKDQSAIQAEPTEQSERMARLRQGDILTDGGYLKKGVWGTMEGVVEAPPNIVWRLFIYANDWTHYGLPDMIDCRAVNESILDQVKETRKVEDFYKALGNQVIDPVEHRVPHTKWENYTFQYFNVPWPVSNKWFVIKNHADETQSDSEIYKTTWDKMAGNVRRMSGELDLEPFEGDRNRTLLRYRVEADPGGFMPRFLLKWGVKKSMPQAIRVIRRESVRLKNKPVPLLKIQ